MGRCLAPASRETDSVGGRPPSPQSGQPESSSGNADRLPGRCCSSPSSRPHLAALRRYPETISGVGTSQRVRSSIQHSPVLERTRAATSWRTGANDAEESCGACVLPVPAARDVSRQAPLSSNRWSEGPKQVSVSDLSHIIRPLEFPGRFSG